jgi:hypothetical protein
MWDDWHAVEDAQAEADASDARRRLRLVTPLPQPAQDAPELATAPEPPAEPVQPPPEQERGAWYPSLTAETELRGLAAIRRLLAHRLEKEKQ